MNSHRLQSPAMAVPLTCTTIGAYTLRTPSAWGIELLPTAPPYHALHLRPSDQVAFDFAVLGGLGSREIAQQFLTMYREEALGGSTRTVTLDLPSGTCDGLAFRLPFGETCVHREVYALSHLGNLLGVSLTWEADAQDVGQLRRHFELVLFATLRANLS